LRLKQEAPQWHDHQADLEVSCEPVNTCYTDRMKQTFRAIALVVVALLSWQTMEAQQGQQGQPNYLALSFERYQEGRYQDSIDAAQNALKADPKSSSAYNNIAVSLLALKRYDEAIANAQLALRIQPDFALAANNLAWIQGEKAKVSGLVPLPKSAAATPESHLEQSYNAYLHGQFHECITAAQDALRLRPGYADAYNNLGACSAGLGKWDEAIRNAQEALRLRPDYPLAKNNLGFAMQMKSAPRQ
jgi:tetratricopeptide (TPR) repeat protein